MTDNRTNEPTPEQVEAAYRAWITFPHKRGPQNAENAIRAALAAADAIESRAKSSQDFVLPSVEQIAEVLAASYDPEYGNVDDSDLHAARAVRALFGEVAGDE